ncbi:MAG: DNA cytosine methyltransferase [Blastocatellia bacterium]|nr:DNA cytosine methyltransferase [Blastocatellia bacterium]
MKTNYRLGELFCGPGGIALGAKMASEMSNSSGRTISHAWATDYDKDTCHTYSRNICNTENP